MESILYRKVSRIKFIPCFDFPGGSDGKETACSEGELGSIPGLGSSPGGEHGNPLQYSCLENPMGRGAWQAAVNGIAKTLTLLSLDCKEIQQSILKEISPGSSLEGMMLKLKLQYSGHPMQRVDSLEKTLMLGGIGGRRRRG